VEIYLPHPILVRPTPHILFDGGFRAATLAFVIVPADLNFVTGFCFFYLNAYQRILGYRHTQIGNGDLFAIQ
jgi:hypothetical protein